MKINEMGLRRLRQALRAALEEIWQLEIIEPEMYDQEIGHDNNYENKEDWVQSKLITWTLTRKP